MPASATPIMNKQRSFFARHIGVAYGLLASFCLTLSMLAGKKVRKLPGPELSWFRSCMMCIFSFPYVSGKDYKLFNYKGYKKLLFIRAMCSAFGSVALYTSVLLVPLPDATAVKYCSVAITPLFARIILKERLTVMQLFTIVICLLGVVCIGNPFMIFDRLGLLIKIHFRHDNHTVAELLHHINGTSAGRKHGIVAAGAMLASITAVCEALAYCVTRKVACAGIPASVILFNLSSYGSAIIIPVCMIYRLIVKSLPELELRDLGFISLSAIAAMLGHVSMTKALHREHAGLISIVKAMDIVFSFIFQYAFFSVRPTRMTFIGAALIVISVVSISLYNVRRSGHDHRHGHMTKGANEGKLAEEEALVPLKGSRREMAT